MSTDIELTALIQARVPDDDGVLNRIPLSWDTVLMQALNDYSQRMPLIRTGTLTPNGVTTLFAVPAGWQRGWSQVLSVEYPAGEEPASYLGVADWAFYQDALDALFLRFVSAPASGTTVRVRYTAVHTAATVPPMHETAIAVLGAAVAHEILASYFAARGDTSFQADIADHAGRSQRYADLARALREQFDVLIPDPKKSDNARRRRVPVVRV